LTAPNARARRPKDRAWAFLLPAYAAIGLIVGVPTVYSLYLSFHQWKLR
jgi:ABC-type sugar transport system permease subunit